MRTKPVEGVLRLDVVTLDPRPAIYLAYDGLAGLSQRAMLRDLIEELQRQGPETLKSFIEAVRKHHSGQVHVYFSDYVSYGIGGGDATAEFFFGTFLVLHEASKNGSPEEILLQRTGGTERFPLDSVAS
ncbi:MAG: hypothetical protein L3J95_05055 [Thermoplasmata archaeon]|nr:hypothetical protein [Thermoplasmata archaeon]MCI4359769.1 hypothetical protein [Thermoplasmata archaeon]